jgi:hypothetical protein
MFHVFFPVLKIREATPVVLFVIEQGVGRRDLQGKKCQTRGERLAAHGARG